MASAYNFNHKNMSVSCALLGMRERERATAIEWISQKDYHNCLSSFLISDFWMDAGEGEEGQFHFIYKDSVKCEYWFFKPCACLKPPTNVLLYLALISYLMFIIRGPFWWRGREHIWGRLGLGLNLIVIIHSLISCGISMNHRFNGWPINLVQGSKPIPSSSLSLKPPPQSIHCLSQYVLHQSLL